MKILPAKSRYQCDHCERVYFHAASCLQHEDKCYKNPKRNCPTCKNTGRQTYEMIYPNMQIKQIVQECSPCKIAGVAGGMSYL